MRFGAQKPFLTANWRYLAMLNYRIDPALLANYVPPEVELDSMKPKRLSAWSVFSSWKRDCLDCPFRFIVTPRK